MTGQVLEVLAPGPQTTVQDLGRPGWAHLGVARSGAADRAALALANRLVGNHPGAAGLEVTAGGLVVRLTSAATVALTGARAGADWAVARSLPAGTVVRLGTPSDGLRSYLAVRGGVAVPPVLGSRSTDALGGLGPAPLRAGDVLPVGDEVAGPVPEDPSAVPPRPSGPLRVVPGPRDDWFAPDTLGALTEDLWTVRSDSDRVGVRLTGTALVWHPDRVGHELPSEPTVPGAVQVPPDGRPILLGPDAPVTGGYPVLAVVVDADLDAVGQLRPGDPVRFRVG